MLIYIIHKDKIYDYRLSNKIFGKYILTDYDKFGLKRNLVNIEAKDNKWYMFENEDVKIMYNGQNVKNISLSPYHFYTLVIQGIEAVSLYVMPLYDNTFIMKEVVDNSEIVIGSKNTSDIVYQGGIADSQLKLKYENGRFTYETLSDKCPIYVNKKLSNKGVLNNFDTIFILGLRVIIFHNKLLLNNITSVGLVFNPSKFKESTLKLITNDNNTSVRTFTNFYDEADYYFKSPVFKSNIKPLDIEITIPPSETELDKSSLVMTIVPMAVMSIGSIYTTIDAYQKYTKGEIKFDELLPSLIMAFGLIFVSILWPFIEKKIRNIQTRITNVAKKHHYKKYLKNKEEVLKKTITEQKLTLETNNMTFENCKRSIENKTAELFHRDYDSNDFLDVCLGKGDVPLSANIKYSKPDYVEENNDLLDDIDKILDNNKYIKDAPIVTSLKDKNIMAFILEDRSMYNTYMRGIILQLITMQSPLDLKLIVLTNEDSEISFLKDTEYCWSNDHTFRYYATNLEEGQEISSALERELKTRKENKEKEIKTYYMVISDSIDTYRNLNIIDDIIDLDKKYCFGMLMYDMRISNIPNNCTNFVNISKNDGTIFETNVNANDVIHFKPSFITDTTVDVDACARMIANIPMKSETKGIDSLPDSLGFLEMFGVGNIEQLNISKRWEDSVPFNSLAAPLGVDANRNLISLDLHEKNHGPHGLIAGMTGSGKSEFIVTYILSLAINYRPDEVQFVLIDYKGGGLGGAFENRRQRYKLPHLVGTITNLDVSEMKRTLVSINSELKRRQRLFNEAKEMLNTGNIDIYKYQKLYREKQVKEPLSHLFIICDEFAELKAQQPDFMDELVSAARIGRSLGIHLILATQKPTGVVDEQIWSNTRFRVCCKVQTTEDSNEMIKKPDAAYLKQAGSFYLQVGYDEYFIEGQSAYSGFPYVPSERILSKIDNDIVFINNTGSIYKSIVKDSKIQVQKGPDLGEELINILKYVISESERLGYKYQQLWLDNIPQIIYYNNIINKYNVKPQPFNIEPVIGEYDDPKNQRQGFVSLPITMLGNTFIAGSSGSGKSTLLSTMIYSTIINHNCNEVNIYILDFGQEKLKKYRKAPQIGDFVTIQDLEKIKHLFFLLDYEKNKRQQYYSENGSDFLTDVKRGKSIFPNILVFIYDIQVFKETYDEIYDDYFAPFTRNCSKFGINFIVADSSAGSLGYLVENNFPQKLMLNMVDNSDYLLFFNNAPIPSKNPGRGVVAINNVPYEFQTSLIFDENSEIKNLNYIIGELNKYLKNKTKPIPIVPEEVKFDEMKLHVKELNRIPIGVNMITALNSYVDFSKLVSLVTTSEIKTGEKFINPLIKMTSLANNTTCIVLNSLTDLNLDLFDNIKVMDNGFKQISSVLSQNINKYKNESHDSNFVIFILGYAKIENFLEKEKENDETVQTIDDLVEQAKDINNFKFVIFDSSHQLREVKKNTLFNHLDGVSGIWIGKGVDSQNIIETEETYTENVKQTNDTLAKVINSKIEYIKYMK